MNMQDGLRLTGDVMVILEDVETGVLTEIARKNLVVTTGKDLVAKLLGGHVSFAALEEITTIAWGTSGTAAAVGDTSLGDQQFEKAASVTYLGAGQVAFEATMLDSEGGNHTYREIGLKTKTSGILFSRVVIPEVTKSTSYKLRVVWTITVQ